ncbi:deoxyribonuclease [Stieleria sp. ICT_E10.1]|uniref:endonuclease/exonuclease/phosphatase family protein n=1 Tax=Stieleria sedimenti TaxID=2976331 RepID=UPI0021809812|nr:endonuclease/exonuclease/phosphatase family protein [Stieleria sedimenti]MCS7467217.1 deoxyribonuclease [Stieleria sedimenti]
MGIFSKRRRKSSYSSTSSLLRWFGPGATTLGLLYALYLMLTGGLSFSSLDGLLGPDSETAFRGETISLGDRTERPPDRIRIATFNIEHFADKKSSIRQNEDGVDVLGTIAKIVSTFDVVAIQELQGADGIALQRLVGLLNESGGTYAATMSDPIGEAYLESYAFVWDRSRINLVPGSAYVVQDPGKRMYREPMVATFETVVPKESTQRPFRFTMINVHTKPDRVDPADRDSEINVLADVFQRVREYEFQQYSEDDFILLGDLNVSEKDLGQLKSIPGVLSLAADIQTNINRTKTNDHILIDSSVTAEYSGRLGVIDLKADLGLTEKQANAISDHIPLWAEFNLYEQPPATRATATATASGPGTRLIQ